MTEKPKTCIISRRTALVSGTQTLAAIAILGAGVNRVVAKEKAEKEDFFFQETPNDDGKNCSGCINFTSKATGQYGADSGDCALLKGDVCKHCYCQGWTDKNDPKSKKAGA